MTEQLRRTRLYEFHRRHGGRMVAFAGYEMPVRYEAGPIAEHEQCRNRAALFDVSHMGVVEVAGPGAAAALETLVPASVTALVTGQLKYSFLTNDAGGVLDDLILTGGTADHVGLVVNAATKDADIAHLRAGLPGEVTVTLRDDLALIALQGPAAVDVVARHHAPVAELTFMHAAPATVAGHDVIVSRSGYTGEDGVEITVAADAAAEFAEALLAHDEVGLAGLAARDSLRLEAGLCLYGHDLDPATTPVEAGLTWAIPPRRRREGGFPGAAVIQRQLAEGPDRTRIGLRPVGRKPVREGASLVAPGGEPVGTVTSGGYGPTVGAPIAMGYVRSGWSEPGTRLDADVRGSTVPCDVVALPFVPHRYHR